MVGFGSFLAYLGYGYLDTWHGAATLVLLPCFVGGLWVSRHKILGQSRDGGDASWTSLLRPAVPIGWRSRFDLGRACLLAVATGMIGAGLTIQVIGMTSVFVDTDLEFIGTTPGRFAAINPRLIPLIAHDRAGFGGAVATAGLLTFAVVWFARPCRSLWEALFLGGTAGWATAIGVHPAIGYTDMFHLAPAVAGAVGFFLGLALTHAQEMAHVARCSMNRSALPLQSKGRKRFFWFACDANH